MNTRGKAGGLALVAKRGRDYMAEIGKRGFEKTTILYFGGDRKKHVQWLYRRGQWMMDKDLTYHKPAIYYNPGDHPAREKLNGQGVAVIREWLEHAEANMGD
jgi:hypothetical protein